MLSAGYDSGGPDYLSAHREGEQSRSESASPEQEPGPDVIADRR